jgi:hypothetical protein
VSHELFYFNGVNGDTGDYDLDPMTPERLFDVLRGVAEPENIMALKSRARWNPEKHLRVVEGVDPTKVAQTGWGVIFPADPGDTSVPAIKEALNPLLRLRLEQAGDLFRMYEGVDAPRPGESTSEFLVRHRVPPADPANPVKMPYYLLLVGDPEQISYDFQSQLDVQYATGRIHFETLQGYANYAASVVAAETGQVALPRKAAFFGVMNADDRATELSTTRLVEPLLTQMQTEQQKWDFAAHLRENATKSQLARLLGGDETPALLFTASHGVPFRPGSSRQLRHQGALLCQEWPGPIAWKGRGEIPEEHYLAGDALVSEANLLGMIAFFFACFSGGTPRYDDFPKPGTTSLNQIAPRPFVSRLPMQMLGQKKGALAVIAHIERTWGSSFMWGQDIEQTDVFRSTLSHLMKGDPVGVALEHFNSRYATWATELSVLLRKVKFGTQVEPVNITNKWTAHNDARGYAIIGDPAVRLSLASSEDVVMEHPAIHVLPVTESPEALPAIVAGPALSSSDTVASAGISFSLAEAIPMPANGQATLTIPPIPNIFTNQRLINAFFYAAQVFEVAGDDLMRKAGLDVRQLAASEATRQMQYSGLPLADLPQLTQGERLLIATNLLRELRNVRRWRGQVNAPAGLNLRSRPGTDAAILAQLVNGTPLDVLHEDGDWHFVAVDAETAGYAFAALVAPVGANTPVPPAPNPPAPARAHFRTDPEARSVPLAPPDNQRIVLGPAAGPGARNLAGIWNRYGGLLTLLANRLQIDADVAVAVLAVESGGAAFAADGRMIIRFENHLFYHDWGRHNQERFFQHFDFDRTPNQSWKNHRWRANPQDAFVNMHTGAPGTQALEWQVLAFAARLDDTAAKRSISMGAPQILGRNHLRIGYATVQEMFDAFASDERNHILGLFDFIRADGAMVNALQRNLYVDFAKGYNGPGQAAFYGNKIQEVTKSIKLIHEAQGQVAFAPGMDEAAPLPSELEAEISYLPMPELPDYLHNVVVENGAVGEQESSRPGSTPGAVDPRVLDVRIRVLEAWAAHMEQGLENNARMFDELRKAFIRPYYITIAMYVLLFLVGIGLFGTSAFLSVRAGSSVSALLFGGLGVVTFLTFFISRPLSALEENLFQITRLGVIYNTYWTRLLYMQDSKTIQNDLEAATKEAITEIDRLTDKSTDLSQKRSRLALR